MQRKRRKLNSIKKFILLAGMMGAFILPFFLSGIPQPVLAASNPLDSSVRPVLKSCFPYKDVDYEHVTITLYFNHNVADASVRKNNTKQISVQSKDGENIHISVSYSDDFALRQEIYITLNNIHPDTTYYVNVGYGILAANGNTASKDMQTVFKTKVETADDGSGTKYSQGQTNPGDDSGGTPAVNDPTTSTTPDDSDPSTGTSDDPGMSMYDNSSKSGSSDDGSGSGTSKKSGNAKTSTGKSKSAGSSSSGVSKSSGTSGIGKVSGTTTKEGVSASGDTKEAKNGSVSSEKKSGSSIAAAKTTVKTDIVDTEKTVGSNEIGKVLRNETGQQITFQVQYKRNIIAGCFAALLIVGTSAEAFKRRRKKK